MGKEIKLTKDELFNEIGSKKCNECQCPCCTLNIPPFLTSEDISRIISQENIPFKDFVEKKNRQDGKNVYYAKTYNNKNCIFYNKKTKKCGIYISRPVDCRLFPLDIIKLKNEYYWINYDICKVSKKISNEIIEYANKNILPLLSKYIDIYSTEITSLWSEGKGVIVTSCHH